MTPSVYEPLAAHADTFCSFWADRYDGKAWDAEHYLPYINDIRSPEAVIHLFTWKNGLPLSAKKRQSVEQNYVAGLDRFNALPLTASPADFLATFPTGGVIWRIFWLHCWQPKLYPIFDMHVYRAMARLLDLAQKEIDGFSDKSKIDCYLGVFLPFCRRFAEIDHRLVDQALVTYGAFIRQWPLATLG